MKSLLVLFILSVTCLAHAVEPLTNRRAPEIDLSQVLQGSGNTPPTLASLRGKAVVLEFWATWCGGCVAAIPHLNQLADQFKGKPVVFLSVTDENPDLIRTFLKRRPMNSWIGIDKGETTFEKYAVGGRPETILIDPKGVLREITDPARIDAARIDKLLTGQQLVMKVAADQPPSLPMELRKGVPPPLLQVMIRPAAAVSVSGYSPGFVAEAAGGRIEYYGATVGTLLYDTEHMRDDRLIAPPWVNQARYDASIAVPSGRADLRDSLLEQAVIATFSLKLKREQRPVSIYVLTAADSSKLTSSTAKASPGFASSPGHFTGAATSVSRLESLISYDLDEVEVIDETGLTGLYDFDLTWQKGSAESLVAALHDQLGLNIKKEIRNREFLVVAEAVQPTTW